MEAEAAGFLTHRVNTRDENAGRELRRARRHLDIVTREDDAEVVTVCNVRIVQQTYLWEREPSPVCSRCKAEGS